jgi:two-component system sensor histidine kinase HydH
VRRAQILAVLAVVAVAVAVIGLAGARGLAEDRAAIVADFADDQRRRLEEAAIELANDVEKVGTDLELALALAAATPSTDTLASELHAVSAITREYVGMEVRTQDDRVLVRVEAPDAPPGAMASLEAQAAEARAASRARPGVVALSRPGPSPWLRVFARTGTAGPRTLTVATFIDTRPVLAKLRLVRGAGSALLVLGGRGGPAPVSDDALAAAVRALPRDAGGAVSGVTPIAALVRAMRAQDRATVLFSARDAVALGLPRASAVAVTVPATIEDAEPWTLALVASTEALRSQEQAVLRRIVVGALLLGGVLLVLVGYVLRNARRSAALRERLRQADALAHLTEKAEKILDQIPSGVLALGADGRVTAINAWQRARLGDVVGRRLADAFGAVPPAPIARVTALVERAMATGQVQSIHGESLALFGAEGRYSVHAVPLERRLPDVQALLVTEDLSAVQRLEDQLLHSEKLATAGVLSAGIAHEIGTPLNIVRGRAELALARLGDAHPQADGLRSIIAQIDHVSGLIGQLLDFMRPRAVAVQPVEAAAALDAAVQLLGAEAQRRGVALTARAEPGLPALLADPGQLQQVLVNLAMNALDACAPGGCVELRARCGTGDIVLEVDDDGCGIARADRTRVFDPFFTTKKRGQGTGLGLSVVDQLVRGHGASLGLDSEPGRGTTVRMSWPAAGAT